MKSVGQLVLVTLVAVLTLVFTEATARALPPAAIPAGTPDPEAEQRYYECLQACLDRYQRELERCKRNCRVCNLEILFICLSRSTDKVCLEMCYGHAEEVFQACKAACLEA